jgi:S1-C subfamily serine protease
MTTRAFFVGAGALVAAGFVGGLVVAGRLSPTPASGADAGQAAPRPAALPATPAATALPDLSAVAERAVQASVNISSTQQVQVDPFFQLFYGADAVQPQTSLGSGVVVSDDGYVVTNSHVVGDRRASVQVTTSDNREFAATIVGIDADTDLAVLKIDPPGVKPLTWGDSRRLRVAEWVLAVGNPFQFNQSVTLGIVSAVNRHDPMLASYNDFIQTDAAINPGNSGGALVSARGELVGINTMIYSRTGGYQGLGFAIPSALAQPILDELKANGEITRGSIGRLELRTLDAEAARRVGEPTLRGVVVTTLYRSDSAYRAGMQPFDVIVRYGRAAVTETTQLQKLIATSKVGDVVEIEVMRQVDRRGTLARRTFRVPVERRTQAVARY